MEESIFSSLGFIKINVEFIMVLMDTTVCLGLGNGFPEACLSNPICPSKGGFSARYGINPGGLDNA